MIDITDITAVCDLGGCLDDVEPQPLGRLTDSVLDDLEFFGADRLERVRIVSLARTDGVTRVGLDPTGRIIAYDNDGEQHLISPDRTSDEPSRAAVLIKTIRESLGVS